jgi:Holliday junction resolvase-like predicted endonuclease
VASKDKIIYFVEVKYRSSDSQGGGLEYITPKKLNQIKFAAQIWNQQNDWNGDYRILGAAVSDDESIEIIEID